MGSKQLFITHDEDGVGGVWGLSAGSAGTLSALPFSWTEPSPPRTGSLPGSPRLKTEPGLGRGENISGRPSCGTAAEPQSITLFESMPCNTSPVRRDQRDPQLLFQTGSYHIIIDQIDNNTFHFSTLSKVFKNRKG